MLVSWLVPSALGVSVEGQEGETRGAGASQLRVVVGVQD